MLTPGKLLLVVVILLLVFGAGRIAQLGKGLGQGIRNFKKGLQDDDPDLERKQLPPAGPKGDKGKEP
jgi:sec-independent protein translocase protein TatA